MTLLPHFRETARGRAPVTRPPRRWTHYFLVSVLLATAGVRPAWADGENQSIVFYRADVRPPAEIYGPSPGSHREGTYGFSPQGRDTDLVAHARGRTCANGSRTSAYVSVSDNAAWAAEYAWMLSMRSGQPVYVYVIAGTDAFRNMAALLRQVPGVEPRDGAIAESVRQGEWVTAGRIPVETILGHRVYDARAFPRDRDPLSVNTRPGTALIPNPYHVERRPDEHHALEIAVGARSGLSYRFVYQLVSQHPRVGACLSATQHCPSNSTRAPRSADAACAFVERARPETRALPAIQMYLMEVAK
ncbi:enterotoxin A family protein [Burkholderia pyrrocinia]|uniref:enterotoxin A family protein n=1 Tax=Burkholderia pyrrocinia TaxID=60550 RepID=UPI00158A775C|nr:enterotoxin A family protein [Burkholderia pyrrocinia]